jgi:hypothetical protein
MDEQESETLIVIGDDDVIYHPYMIELAESNFQILKARGRRHSLAYLCEEMHEDGHGHDFMGRDKTEICHGYADAFAGVLFERSMFDWPDGRKLWDYDGVAKECFYHDDVYISGMLWRKLDILPYMIDFSASYLFHHTWNSYAIQNVQDSWEQKWTCARDIFDSFGKWPKK